ncbi:MAG TPA: hypothetical protein VKB65_06390 [Myxococcota bacterium]|nr:hypothetical protein [Myxococcota bacterium]
MTSGPPHLPFGILGRPLASHARDLAERALAWSDAWWDPAARLARAPAGAGFAGPGVPRGDLHLVPQSAWYAFGLLLRDGGNGDDHARARSILETLLTLQYDEPGAPWDGTFARFAESPRPPREGAVEWQDYDPNWRQFLGTSFLWTLRCFPDALAPELVAGMERAVRRAVEGEPPGRVADSYANVALMKAWLEVEAGTRLGEPAWVASGEALARRVVARFDRHGAFDEFNSPTYYGIDLFALALWARSQGSAWLAREGPRVAAALWRDLARWYHAGLRNVCAPYTRSYGMDLEAYVALLSLWLWRELGAEHAPLPPLDARAEHGHDLHMGALVASLAAPIPDDARDAFVAFPGPHAVRRRVVDAPLREATGWLDTAWMAGAERCEADLSWWDQYVAGAIHWRVPAASGGRAAWISLRAPGPVDARAGRDGLAATWHDDAPREATLLVHAPGASAAAFASPVWRLPGLTVELTGSVLETTPEADAIRIRLRSSTRDGRSHVGLRVVVG